MGAKYGAATSLRSCCVVLGDQDGWGTNRLSKAELILGLGCPKIYHEAEDTLDGCGEHVRAQVLVAVVDGSSPRVWGTRLYYQSPQRPRRFIPTGVGNTATIYDELYKYAVHPHGCGEHP